MKRIFLQYKLLILLLILPISLSSQNSLFSNHSQKNEINKIKTKVALVGSQQKKEWKGQIQVTFYIPEGKHQEQEKDYFGFKIKKIKGVKLGKISYPKLSDKGEYFGATTLSAPIRIKNIAKLKDKEIKITAFYQICEDSGACLAPTKNQLAINIDDAKNIESQNNIKQKDNFSISTFLTYLLMAFLGGMILNVMPCVLPVLSIKAMNLIRQTEESSKEIAIHTALYTIGILTTMVIFASSLILIQQLTGDLINWGSQMQNPVFLFGLVMLLFIFALSLFDVYTIIPPSFASSSKGGRAGAFITGFFVVILGTPCTAPFLAPAAGFFLAQPPLLILLFFFFVGLGLSLPFWVMVFPIKRPLKLFIGSTAVLVLLSIITIILSAIKGETAILNFFNQSIKSILIVLGTLELIAIIPLFKIIRPGNWMNDFKKAMGLIMFGTAAWFLTVYIKDRIDQFFPIMLFLIITAGTFLVFGKIQVKGFKKWIKFLIIGGMLIGVIGSGFLLLNEKYTLPKEKFNSEVVSKAFNNDERFLIIFSADWCLTCKENDRSIFNKKETGDFFEKNKIKVYYGDYTKTNPEITKWIRKFNRGGVPLYIFNAGNKSAPLVLPDDLTKKNLFELIETSMNK